MSWLIGVDEAGLGPNLGPFVVSATRWQIPDDVDTGQLRKHLAAIVTQHPKDTSRLPIVDSKTLFSPTSGLARLEETVLTLLAGINQSFSSFEQLAASLCPAFTEECPCRNGQPLAIPRESAGVNRPLALRFQEELERTSIRLDAIRVAIVWPRTFNALLDQYGNKSTVTTSVNLALVKSIWEEHRDDSTRIVSDKHGGRNRYASELTEITEGDFVTCLEESALMSRYRVGRTEFTFQPRAEEHLPVALASMTAKYVRELAMIRFNRFWQEHLPGIKPTQGYPVDAQRFREQVADLRKSLQISDTDFWRSK